MNHCVEMSASKTSNSQAHGKRATSRLKLSSKNRSRKGCLTCKKKHVKCDETRPYCQNCLEKGWNCGGYSPGLKWSYKHQPTLIDATVEQPDVFFRISSSSQASPSHHDSVEISSEAAALDDFPTLPSYPLNLGTMSGDNEMCPNNGLQFDMPDPVQFANSFEHEIAPMTGSERRATSPESFTSQASADLEQSRILNSTLGLAQQHQPQAPSAELGPDCSLRLINNWFVEVCPAWSCFDSSVNMNRKLASELWHSSAAVFNSLQSMSASFLSARLPHLRRPALNHLKLATVCIKAQVSAHQGKPQLDHIPSGLLFSLLCLGTSICWLDARRLGAPFLRDAKELFQRLTQQYRTTNPEEVDTLSFFKNSLLYWEMLVSVVEDTEFCADADGMPLREGPRVAENTVGETSTDLLPHPWTGISSLTAQLFCRSMRLCRAYRHRINKSANSATFFFATQEINEAERLEEQLLELDFSSIATANDTGDWKTPRLHLAHVAEAYQLASLLQLYITFPGLISLRLPQEPVDLERGVVPWDKWIVPLTLRLIGKLEQIPPDSGSKVIQPLLYICASTGLRYNLSPSTEIDPNEIDPAPSGVFSHSGAHGLDIMDYVNDMVKDEHVGKEPTSMPPAALEIARARNFIVRRLNVLESTLQPKPILVAKELVRAVWEAYDVELAGWTAVHWLDVMEMKDLRSLFG